MQESLTLYSLIDDLVSSTLSVSLPGFAPELALTATIVLMLLARMPRWGSRINAFYIALPGALVALFLTAPWRQFDPATADPLLGSSIFDGMLVYDSMTVYFRGVLLVFLVLFLFLTRISGIPDREDSPDFYTLVFGATIGMCIMASATHMLTVFLGVEMASVPSYALAGILKGRRPSSEAALKYAVYGAGAAGVMLYGISLLGGALGAVHIPTMVEQLATMPADLFAERQMVLVLGGLMVMVGLAFKLSAVPFHFWCPDVFEGAAAEVDAFLSVASKAAALALLIRVALGFAHLPSQPVAEPAAVAQAAAASTGAPVVLASQVEPDEHEAHAHAAESHDAQTAVADPLARTRSFIAGLLAVIAAVTCTFGNLAAYGQTNIKRLLAYSTIAHAGYMMMPVAAAVSLSGSQPAEARDALVAVLFYVGVYLFMNLGAFATVAFLRNVLRSEEIADYAGLVRRSPGVVVLFGTILLSLVGLPPLAGFVAKLVAFSAITSAQMYTLLVIGGLNTVLSLFYYLRVVKVMAIDPEPEDRLPVEFSLLSSEGVYLTVVTLPVLILGLFWDQLHRWGLAAVAGLLS